MNKIINFKIQIILIIVITLGFSLAGYLYNQKLPNSWYFKYSISLTDDGKITIGALDNLFTSNSSLNTHVNLRTYVEDKINLQDLPEQNSYFENLAISSGQISFVKKKTLEDLNENLNNLIKNINDNLKYELKDYLKSVQKINGNLIELSRDLKIKNLSFLINFYKEKGIDPLNYINEDLNIGSKLVEFLASRTGNSLEQQETYQEIMSILTDVKNINSIESLQLELQKIKTQGSWEMAQYESINLLSKSIINTDIIELNGVIQKIDLKPKLYISIFSFALFGLSSYVGILIIFLILRKAKLKKLII